MLIASLGLLLAYSDAGPNKIVNVVLMTLLGFTISGPYNLIVGVRIEIQRRCELAMRKFSTKSSRKL